MNEFLLELIAGLVGVFAGAAMALWTDRQARLHEERKEKQRELDDLANSRRLVISSVVKNTSEAKRLGSLLSADSDPYLFQVTLESAVWEATREQFVRIASADERVLLTRFFDHVRRFTRLIEFHRQVSADMEIRNLEMDAGDRRLLDDLRARLQEVANEIRIDGLVVVSDLGDAMHKRLLGIKNNAEEQTVS